MEKDKAEEEEYLKEMAPTLHSIERDLPDGYFDGLEDRIVNSVSIQSNIPKGRVISILNYRNIAIAAAVALILAIIPYFSNQDEQATEYAEVDITGLDQEAILDYLAEESADELIYEEMFDAPYEPVERNALSDEDIINYLIETDVSESMILESL